MVQCDRDCIQFDGPLFSTNRSVRWGVKSLTLHYKKTLPKITW